MQIINLLVGIYYWIIGPILGVFILPFTPYVVKIKLFKNEKKFPSFIPFCGTLILLVLLMAYIWANYFNGRIFYEWDTNFIQYNLVSYESPLLDHSTWIAKGWSELYLFFLWAVITFAIYVIAATVALFIYRKHVLFLYYRKVIIISCALMFLFGLLTAPLIYGKLW